MEALISFLGSILGKILDWLFARLNNGKLHIALDSFKERFYRHDGFGGVAQIETGEFAYAELSFVIHLYNSCSVTHAIRECELVFLDSADSELARMPIRDKDSCGIVNLDSHTCRDINARISINDIALLHKVSKIEFHYKNEKRKEKSLPYKKIDFTNVRRRVEEAQNDE